MSKVNIEFDTIDKTMKITMDGKVMKNVSDVSSYKSYMEDGKYYLRIMQEEHDDDAAITTVTTTMACDDGKELKKDINTVELAKALFSN